MTVSTLVGLPLAEARERLRQNGQPEPAVTFTAPPRPAGLGRPEDTQPLVPYVVRETDGRLVCALFRTPDPSKEQPKDE